MVKKTPNHELSKFDVGEPNWTHSPDMQAIEERLVIRDVESSLTDYVPYPTTTFVSTDTGATYDGDGEMWQPAARGYGTMSATIVEAGETFRDPSGKEITGEVATVDQVGGVETLLRRGNIVGETATAVYVADPSEFGSDDAAMQSVVDDIQRGSEPGRLRFGPYGTDGDELVIENTVDMNGANGPTVVPYGYGFSRDSGYLRTTIGDGSPMFLVRNGKAHNLLSGQFAASGVGSAQDAELIRFRRMSALHFDNVEARALGGGSPSASGAIVFDSETYNSFITRLRWNGNTDGGREVDVTGSNFIAFENTANDIAPGELAFGYISCYNPPSSPANHGFHSTVDADHLMISQIRLEGFGGTAAYYATRGNAQFTACEFDRMENGCGGIYHTGTDIQIDSSVTIKTGGNGGTAVEVGVGYGGNVRATKLTGGVENDGLIVRSDPPNAPLLIPPRETIEGGTDIPSGTSNIYELAASTT